MISEREQEGNVPNLFLNLVGLWENYLIDWIQASRNLFENTITTNEQCLKAILDPLLKAGSPQQRERVKVE
jgi:hypothetical protein